jgi:hypothetical protein
MDQDRFITQLIFPESWFLRNTGKRRLSFRCIQIEKEALLHAPPTLRLPPRLLKD